MSGWLLPFLLGLKKAVADYLASAEKARHDEIELKIIRELLKELDKLITPIASAAATEVSKLSQTTITHVMNLMKETGTALANYAHDNVADYIEDRGQSNAAAVGASMRLHEALATLLAVIENQRQWLNTRFSHTTLRRLLYRPYRQVEPADFQMQLVELVSVLESVMLEAERAQRDVSLSHHPTRYFLPTISAALAPFTPETETSPASRREPRPALENIKQLRKMYYSTLLFIEEFARQVKTRLEQHTRPAGGISAIIVRAQITLTISFCLQSRLMMEGMRAAINAVGKTFIVAY